jgi:hypothetical protein
VKKQTWGQLSHKTEIALLRKALFACMTHIEINTCAHEETHRGGVLWEICDSCGMKWADDEGGKPKFQEAACVTDARNILLTTGKLK